MERLDRTRRISMKLGGGEAVLTLGPSEPGAGAQGEGTLVADTSEKGAAFVAAFGRWINEPGPPPRATPMPLKALKVQYVRLAAATSRAPEAFRLTLIGGRRQAEIFFNLFPDGTRATFLERGRPDTRVALVGLLAEGLRDGPKPPRTHATDPNIGSDAPLTSSVRPLLPTPVIAASCGARDVYAAVNDGWRTKIVAVTDPAAPPRTITTLDGVVEAMAGSPDGKQIALLMVRATSAEVQPQDLRELRLHDVEKGTLIPFFNPEEGFRGTGLPIWSKQRFVVEGKLLTTSPGDRVVRAYDTSTTPGLLGETKAQLHLRPTRFEGDQVVLAAWEIQPRPRRRTYAWTLGSAPVAKESIPFASPDGRFVFSIDDDKIIAKDGRTFVSTDVDDKAAIRALEASDPIWLGKHVLALQSDIPLALDLETMQVRPVVTTPNVSLVCATSDGKRAVLLSTDGSASIADLGSQVPQ
ncbi:MAG: hypothetical protein ACXVEF_02205 [Polyangiales bacterium]